MSSIEIPNEFVVGFMAFLFPVELLGALPIAKSLEVSYLRAILVVSLGNSLALYCIVGLMYGAQSWIFLQRWQNNPKVQAVADRIMRNGLWLVPILGPFVGTWITSLACTFFLSSFFSDRIWRRRWTPPDSHPKSYESHSSRRSPEEENSCLFFEPEAHMFYIVNIITHMKALVHTQTCDLSPRLFYLI